MKEPLTQVWAFQCQRPACGHIWLPKGGGSAKGLAPPKVCPVCKSYAWFKQINTVR